ncbi:20619_t:CDS:2, partial [Dentiscutata erythropus]
MPQCYGNQEKKGGEKSNDTATVATTETTKNVQMALMILTYLYKRALELKERVWKLDFYTA